MKNKILIAYNLIDVAASSTHEVASDIDVATVINNLAFYGFVPSIEVLEKLRKLSLNELTHFWHDYEIALKDITGANREMDNFVVYKNFPQEVLNMSQAQYWFQQILMYWGLPNELVTQEVQSRPDLKDKKDLKVLNLASEKVFETIFQNLSNNSARWTDNQKEYAVFLFKHLAFKKLDLSHFVFKENGIYLINENLSNSTNIIIKDATDVLRLASAMSQQDISLRTVPKFKKFKRTERRFLLNLLNQSQNLKVDIAQRKNVWKKLLAALHPGDYSQFTHVNKCYDLLYKGSTITLNAQIESLIKNQDENVLKLIQSRAGEFYRRLHSLYNVYDMKAIEAFVNVVPELTIFQLVKLEKYINTINNRTTLIYPPRGNWNKAQFETQTKKPFSLEALNVLNLSIKKEMTQRLKNIYPEGIELDAKTSLIKLQSNDQELAAYGRGTVFDIPESIKFLRSASFWKCKTYGNNFFDNGWNFFDSNWKNKGTVCWNATDLDQAAIFSGDPTNSKDLDGNACQMIDLYIDKLLKQGIRFAVWNILSYSHIPFGQASDVLATLQLGENPEEGNLYEPSRAQMVFPVRGDNLTKYIAYIDLVERKVVYMDANLPARVSSAVENAEGLSEKMPAFLEYLNAQPSVADLLQHAPKGLVPIYYTDENQPLKGKAYVFLPKNVLSQFEAIYVMQLLSIK